MWSYYPPTLTNSNNYNISFGMDMSHICPARTNDKDAIFVQVPIVCFKASTVMQNLGIVVSNGNTQENRMTEPTAQRPTPLPTAMRPRPSTATFLFDHHAYAILAHECVFSVIIQMSNKNPKHVNGANADCASTVVSGMLVCLTPFYKARNLRPVMLTETFDFDSVDQMIENIKSKLVKLGYRMDSRSENQFCPF